MNTEDAYGTKHVCIYCKNHFLLALVPHTKSKMYIITLTGTARKSQSVISFNANTSNIATSREIVQAAKRLHTDNTVNIPAITITTEEIPLSRDEDNRNIIKLNCLVDKKDRYELHVSFLKNCLEIGRVPNGLVINLL